METGHDRYVVVKAAPARGDSTDGSRGVPCGRARGIGPGRRGVRGDSLPRRLL